MSADVVCSTVDFSQKNKGKQAADKTSKGKEDDVIYATVKFGDAPSLQQQQAASSNTADPTAGKAPPYRLAALVLAGLCSLSVAAIIFLSVYILHIQMKYSELERNYTNISATERVCKSCPQNWELFNGKCYYFSTDRMNWKSSRDNCTSLGGHLVIIESDGEQRILSDKAWNITQELSISKEEEKAHWIGLTDTVTEGTWVWVDDTPLIGNVKAKFWATRTHDGGKEPDNYNKVDPSGEDCAQLQPKRNSDETWFDSLCTQQYKRICETKAVIA
ncbi:C-type lectin domain family 4 member E-like [Polyodon spathula]|uniref:C-type lectin domain family 4 member E-like n=1 Tax=Polyodon spathula TaxID=7913 RepID=UPI001B7E4A1D|nr:C-type lectin domain family 4 member E-like [Polyodon spathula]